MKKILLTTFAIIYAFVAIAQIEDIDRQVENCKDKVREVNSIELCRNVIANGGYYKNVPEEYSESLHILYFDDAQRLRKSISTFAFPEEKGFDYRYYDENGVAFCALSGSYSGMNNGFSVIRYLGEEGQLLYVDFLRIDDDNGGRLIEHITRYGGYGLSMPGMYGLTDIYDPIYNIDSFFTLSHGIYNHLSVSNEKCTPVKLTAPLPGQSSIVNDNNVPLLIAPGSNQAPVAFLNVRDKVTILKKDKDWVEVIFKEWKGYVREEFLEPVEMP